MPPPPPANTGGGHACRKLRQTCRAAAGAPRACDPSLAVGVRRASFRAKRHGHHKTHTLLWSPTVVSTCAQWRNGGQRQRAGPCLRATCTHGCAGRRGHAKDCPGSRARASPADRYGGKSLTAVVPAARQPSSRAVGWTRRVGLFATTSTSLSSAPTGQMPGLGG